MVDRTAGKPQQPNPCGNFARLYRRVMALRALSGNAKVIHALLCDLAVFKEEAVACGLDWIGDQCGLSKPAVVEAVRELEAAGLLIVERTTGGRRCRNFYTPQVPLEDSDPAKLSERLTVWKRERARERMRKRSARPTGKGRNVLPQTVGTSYHQNGRHGGSVDNSLPQTISKTISGQRPTLPFLNCPEKEEKEASTQIEAPPEPKATVGGNRKHEEQEPMNPEPNVKRREQPADLAEAIDYGHMKGIPEDFARTWFAEWEGQNWRMRGGGPMASWRSSLSQAWRRRTDPRLGTEPQGAMALRGEAKAGTA